MTTTWQPDDAGPCYRRSDGGHCFAVVRASAAPFAVEIQPNGDALGPHPTLDDAKAAGDQWCADNDP